MIFKKFLALALLPLMSMAVSAESINVQIVENAEASNCQSNQYCVNIQSNTTDGETVLPGNSSIRFKYDANVLRFEGRSGNVAIGSYESKGFLQKTTCTNFNPYVAHSFDGLIPGDFLISTLLQAAFVNECSQKINSEWTDLTTICFEVLDQNANPKFEVVGSQNGSPINTSGTNFNSKTNHPSDKLNNGSFAETNASFKSLCETASGIENVTVGQGWALVSLQPVPVKDVLLVQVESTLAERASVQVFDLTGKMISNQDVNLNEGDNQLEIDASDYASGAYFISITKGDETLADKFIKK